MKTFPLHYLFLSSMIHVSLRPRAEVLLSSPLGSRGRTTEGRECVLWPSCNLPPCVAEERSVVPSGSVTLHLTPSSVATCLVCMCSVCACYNVGVPGGRWHSWLSLVDTQPRQRGIAARDWSAGGLEGDQSISDGRCSSPPALTRNLGFKLRFFSHEPVKQGRRVMCVAAGRGAAGEEALSGSRP